MRIFDELGYLETYFINEMGEKRKLTDIYEKVQYAPHIIPRLYLLITTGSAMIRKGESQAKDVLIDLLDIIKGV